MSSLPSCPSLLRPQQDTSPVERRAQVCQWPAVTSTASSSPTTLTGSGSEFAVAPLPSSPLVSSPQHETSPVAWTAQVCSQPAPTATASVMPCASTGTEEFAAAPLSPLPSCPCRLLPQQSTLPSLSVHEWLTPAAMSYSGGAGGGAVVVVAGGEVVVGGEVVGDGAVVAVVGVEVGTAVVVEAPGSASSPLLQAAAKIAATATTAANHSHLRLRNPCIEILRI